DVRETLVNGVQIQMRNFKENISKGERVLEEMVNIARSCRRETNWAEGLSHEVAQIVAKKYTLPNLHYLRAYTTLRRIITDYKFNSHLFYENNFSEKAALDFYQAMINIVNTLPVDPGFKELVVLF
ncbi:MAG: hypothetical protein M3R00_08100, partial [Pseudomonadota bacterium]|nr:hypothetical protein [Pseudomonadota bacterium]